MTAASNSEARKRLADPTPHTDPTAAAVRAAQAEAWQEGALRVADLLGCGFDNDHLARLNPYRADRIATDTAAPEGVEWTADQHYARGMAAGLGETYAYLLRHGPNGLGEWLKRREQGFMALLPRDEHGNTQFQPLIAPKGHWTERPHTHGGTDCGGGEGCPCAPTAPVAVEGVETVEWNVLDRGMPYLQPWTEDEDEARSYSNCVTGPLVHRTRLQTPDRVSEWSRVEPETSEPEGGES